MIYLPRVASREIRLGAISADYCMAVLTIKSHTSHTQCSGHDKAVMRSSLSIFDIFYRHAVSLSVMMFPAAGQNENRTSPRRLGVEHV